MCRRSIKIVTLSAIIYLIVFIFQKFFEDVISESQRDKNNIINDIDELLIEKQVLEKVKLLNFIIFI